VKILVTGAGGFLGRYVVAAAVRRGHEVRAMVRPASKAVPLDWLAHPQVEVVRCDLRARGTFDSILDGIDVVVHLAAAKSGDLYEQLGATVLATENLLHAMARVEINRLVVVSSFSVYDYQSRRSWSMVDEASPLAKNRWERDEYCQTKIEQERIVREHAAASACPCIILRPGVIFGRGNLWNARLGVQMSDRWWIGTGTFARVPLTYVENCALAVVMAVEGDDLRGETILNVVDDDAPSQRTYLNELRRQTRARAKIIPVPWMFLRAVSRMIWCITRFVLRGNARVPGLLVPARLHARCKPMRYTNELARRTLGWKPIYTWREGIERSVRGGDLTRLVPWPVTDSLPAHQIEEQVA
jgi:2-alkyl-3-oxoalkanoate reductase